MYTAVKYLFITLILIFLSGCVIPFPIKADLETPIDKEELENIERGKTTRLEIIEWLGPPDAIARTGTTIKVPPLGPRKEGSLNVNSQDFLDLFSEKHTITPKHIVYYYETSTFHATGLVAAIPTMPIGMPVTGEDIVFLRLRVSRLWILVDTETGHVVDYLFREERGKLKKGHEAGKMNDSGEDYD